MCSENGGRFYRVAGGARARALLLAAVASVAIIAEPLAQSARTTPRFYSDDPLSRDDDAAFDASKAEENELSETFDFLTNTFASPGDRRSIRAVNVNTLDEVPDSTWFTNRIGLGRLTESEAARGGRKFDRLDAEEWLVTRGKGPGGFHPGFRASHPGDPDQVYQLEVDPKEHPQLASGAELIGALVYHALGYNVQDVYTVRVDPSRLTISPKATVRDASGQRAFVQSDLDAVLSNAARDSDGRFYMSATRFSQGEDLGQFRYFGTRRDDPNDIHPHEHRRELRANRVFAAWLAHDDSRAVNTLNLRVETEGRKFIRHYMHDFGALLGSATRFAEPAINNHEHFIPKDSSLKGLAGLGFYFPRYARSNRADDLPPSVGNYDSVSFEPAKWRANYPNPAFENMRADDAFWGARLVSRFSDELLTAIVGRVGYDDPRAASYLVKTLGERRDLVARRWLNGVNPIVDIALSGNGELTFTNAAVDAGVATAGARYRITWGAFDNDRGQERLASGEVESTATKASLPAESFAATLKGAQYAVAHIRAEHAEHPAWATPVDVYFRREGAGWQTVGIFRLP